MDQNRDDFEEARPEDDWGLSLEEQRALAEKRGRPTLAIEPSLPLAPIPQEPKSKPTALPAPLAQQPCAPAPAPVSALPLPNREKLDQFPAFATRSALFCASKHAAALPPSTPVKAQGTYALRAGGPRLDMRDKAAWEAAMQLAKESSDPSQDIPVNLSELARRVGLRDVNGACLARVWKSLERLAQVDVELTLQGKIHAGRMLAAATVDGRSRSIRVDLGLCAFMLESDSQFKIVSARRHALSSSLAQWLHDFFSTHSAYGGALTVGYLRELCGFEGQARRFPALLDTAMAELAAKAPDLVATHRVKKSGRSSEKWTLEVDRGPETPVFTKPKASNTLPSAHVDLKSRQPQKWLAL